MDPWMLVADEPAAGRLYLANGYMSTALDWEGGLLSESSPAPCYVRGVYGRSAPEGIDHLALMPCWSRLRYGAPGRVLAYRRSLDLRRATVTTSVTLEEERGLVHLEHTMLVSRDDQHQAAVRLVIRPTFDGEIVVLAALEAPLDG